MKKIEIRFRVNWYPKDAACTARPQYRLLIADGQHTIECLDKDILGREVWRELSPTATHRGYAQRGELMALVIATLTRDRATGWSCDEVDGVRMWDLGTLDMPGGADEI